MADVIALLRAAAAHRAAVIRYTAASEAHASRESVLLLMGYEHPADYHHWADLTATRALAAELDDPAPKRAEGPCGVCPGDCDDCDVCGR